jgi:hypothetical protein
MSADDGLIATSKQMQTTCASSWHCGTRDLGANLLQRDADGIWEGWERTEIDKAYFFVELELICIMGDNNKGQFQGVLRRLGWLNRHL